MFITFEGLDGSGKTTQIKLLHNKLQNNGYKSIMIREPGGTSFGDKIRDLILQQDEEYSVNTVFLLFSASRSHLVDKVIKPSLYKNIIVLCDRFYDSTFAYQCYSEKLNIDFFHKVNDNIVNDVIPDITFFIDINPIESINRRLNSGELNKYDLKDIEFYNNVYEGYQLLLKHNSKRFFVVDGNNTVDNIHNTIYKKVMYDLTNLWFGI